MSEDEQRFVTEMYRKHGGLLRMMGRKLCRKYPYLRSDDVYSCIDVSFIKSCRAWDPLRGTFSTVLTHFAEGEVLHFIRDSNWMVKAPCAVRRNGQVVRKLMKQGMTAAQIQAQLGLTAEQVRHALVATQGLDHDPRDFDAYECPRATPWELLEEGEAA